MGTKYVRIQGRVKGPYDEERLRTMATRGILGRMHEVSEDGNSWESASNYPQLFVSNRDVTPESEREPWKDQHEHHGDQVALPTAPEWHYSVGGSPKSPVDFPTLQLLVQTGQLKGDDIVWREGMPDWVSVDLVPGLVPEKADEPNVDSGLITDDVVRSLDGSRRWVLFIAILGFVYTAATVSAGFFWMIRGAQADEVVTVVGGLMTLVSAIIYGVGAMMLTIYTNRIGRFASNKSEKQLAATLEQLRIFWVYIGMVLIVVLALLVIFVIWLVAFSGTWPGLF